MANSKKILSFLLDNIIYILLGLLIIGIVLFISLRKYNFIEKFEWSGNPTYKGDPTRNSGTLISSNIQFITSNKNNLFFFIRGQIYYVNNELKNAALINTTGITEIISEPIIACNDKLLVIYNNNPNLSTSIFYIKISEINQTGKTWQRLMFPTITQDNSTDTPGVTLPPQYDFLNIITLSDSYIFGYSESTINIDSNGNQMMENNGSIYYCKLNNDGLPIKTDTNFWNKIDITFKNPTDTNPDISVISYGIKLMKANSNTLFIVQSVDYEEVSDTDTTIKTLSNTINYFTINTDTVLNDRNSTLFNNIAIIDDIAVNNDVIWVTDNNISSGSLQLWWSILENGTFKTSPNWQSINSLYNSIIDMSIYNNNLLFLSNMVYYMILYDPNITTQATTTGPTTTTVTTTNGITRPITTSITRPITTRGNTNPTTTTATTKSIKNTNVQNPSTTSRGDFLLGLSDSNPGDDKNDQSNDISSDTSTKSKLPGILLNDILNGLSNNNISPQNNTDNLSNNNMFGNNIYISPMNNFPGPTGNESSLIAGINVNPDQIEIQNANTKRKITSMFFPMIKMI